MRVIALLAVLSIATFVSHPAQAQDAAAGEKVFTKCKVCHIADQDKNLIGPSLHGVIGRTAGTHPNFAYSAAMVAAGKSGVKWDEPTLTTYLHDPRAIIEGLCSLCTKGVHFSASRVVRAINAEACFRSVSFVD